MDRTLSRGMTGGDVSDLQAALNYHLRPPLPPHTPDGPPRPPLKTDGNFGPLTQARLKEFQKLNGLVDDGVVGRKTRPVLKVVRRVTAKIPIAKSLVGRVGASPAAAAIGDPVAPAPSPSSGPLVSPLRLQNRQVQVGGNLTLDPILGPGAVQKTFFLSVQWNWVEQKDGRHLELALGTQFAAPLGQKDLVGFGFSLQSFAQVSISDVLTFDDINLHVFNFSAQVAAQSNFVNDILKSNAVSASVQNQFTWDMIVSGKNPRFSLFCQQQLGYTYDLGARKGTIAPAFLAGAIWQTNFF